MMAHGLGSSGPRGRPGLGLQLTQPHPALVAVGIQSEPVGRESSFTLLNDIKINRHITRTLSSQYDMTGG